MRLPLETPRRSVLAGRLWLLIALVPLAACLDPVGLSDEDLGGTDVAGDQDLDLATDEDAEGDSGELDATDLADGADASGDPDVAEDPTDPDQTDLADAADAADLAEEPDASDDTGAPLAQLTFVGRSNPPSLFPKGARFGATVAIDGNLVGVGYPLDRNNDGFAQIQTIPSADMPGSPVADFTPTRGEPDTYGGSAIAFDGDTFVMGAPGADAEGSDRIGTAFYFLRDGGWDETGLAIVPDDEASPSGYGDAVAAAEPYIAVGAPDSDQVFVFHVTDAATYELEATLDGEASSAFGASLAMDGDYLIVGAPDAEHEEETGTGLGAVYLRSEEGTWDRSGMDLLGGEAAPGEPEEIVQTEPGVGRSVAISEVAGGSPLHLAVVGSDSSGIWLFESGDGEAWRPCGRVREPVFGGAEDFGRAVALDGDTVAFTSRDAVFVYRREACREWRFVAYGEAPEAEGGEDFGISVDIDGDYVVVGSPGVHKPDTTPAVPDFGALYVYEIVEE